MVCPPPHVGRPIWQYPPTSYLQKTRLTKQCFGHCSTWKTMIWTCWPFSSLPQDLGVLILDLGVKILEFGFWILEFGFWSLGFWILDFGSWSLDFGFWSLDFGFWSFDIGSWSFDFGFWSFDFGIWIFDFGVLILDLGYNNYIVSKSCSLRYSCITCILDFGVLSLDSGFWLWGVGFWMVDNFLRSIDLYMIARIFYTSKIICMSTAEHVNNPKV